MNLIDSVGNQAYIFIWSVFGGMLIAFIYDVFRLIRRAAGSKKIALYLEDFIYWIVVALTLFGVMYYSNDGELRGFIFVGTALGVILYALLLSKFVMAVMLTIIGISYRIVKISWRILSYPLKIILRILGIPFFIILKILRKFFKGAKGIGKTRLSKTFFWNKAFKIIRKKI